MNFKKSLFLLVVVSLIATLFSQSSVLFAIQAKDRFKAKTEITSSSITLNWDKIGTEYKIYRDGNLIGETKENSFVDATIKADVLYKYLIAAYDDKKITDIVRISTKAKTSLDKGSLKKENQNNTLDMTIESVAGSNFITLNWPKIPDDDNVYQVYRNGSLIANVSDTQFTDQDVVSSTRYRYNVIGKKKLSDDDVNKIKKELKKKHDNNVSDEKLLKLENTYEAIKFVKTLDSDLQTNFEVSRLKEANFITMSSDSPYFSFRYMTFIPDYRVPNPFQSGTYFLGNNRSYDVLSYDYKTLQNIDVTFDQPLYSTYRQRTGVGTTYLVDEDNNFLSSKTANCTADNGAYDLYLLSPNSYETDKKQFGAGGDCGIPYNDNITPDITYYYDAWIERDGDWRVKGSHDKAPAHEFYIYDGSIGSYTTIFQHGFDGNFNNLFPFYPNWTFDISG
ncbi:DUF3238 domain-containing protein [Aquibacillus salsiterrae]|uniref:DUF3238 domain-containing protein n=1 Tax=Aquibacillus salsiterrae TaxID=2950439 RepID=A0A9X3WHE2_9BACI|nr:DUF3238 domain-containing protein [Aquibacillus salsiterrae]MDC3418485.1 DUF3238 domain-containing protein [Aquibacillus salsiterrae]